MSVRAMAWAWRQQTGSGPRKAVLVCLADHSDDDGICWPGQRKVAAKCELDTRTVRRAVRDLQALQLIRVEPRRTEKGQWMSSVTVLALGAETLGVDVLGRGPDPPEGRESVGQDGRRAESPNPEGRESSNGRAESPPNRQTEPSEEPPTTLEPKIPSALTPLVQRLNRVVEGKRAKPLKVRAAIKACGDFSDRDLFVEATRFEEKYLHGEYENKPLRDVAAAWRTWLRRAPRAGRSGGKAARVAELVERGRGAVA